MRHTGRIGRLALLIAVGIGVAGLCGTTRAAEPRALVNYEGVLRDPNGAPQSGDFDMIFRFFDNETLGSEILVDSHLAADTGAVTVSGGLFNVQLGDGEVVDGSASLPNDPYTSLAEVFRDFSSVFMEIQVGGETLAPRIQVVAAPYALNADHLDGKEGSEYIDTSAATQTKAGNLAVADLKVSGQITIQGGTPGAGKVLTSGATGLASWQDLPAAQANQLSTLADRLGGEDPSELPFAALRSFDCSGANTATLSFTAQGATLGSVAGFVGSDRISDTYDYLIAIERNDTTLDQQAFVGLDGRLTLQRAGGTTTFSGLITEFGLAAWDGSVATYVARVEPQMVTMARSSGYDTFGSSTASAILTQLLSDAGLVQDVESTSHVYDLAMRYEESPLDYFNRLVEGEGLHYHFKEDPTQERLLVRGSNAGFTDISKTFKYYGDLQDPGTGEEFVATLHARRRQFTGTATAGGWDYTSKSVISATDTAPGGTGEFREFFADATSGVLTSARAELAVAREQSRRMERSGTSNIGDLKAGHYFTLSDQTTAGFSGDQIVTEIRHYALSDPANSCVLYGNAFSALPLTVEYKPPRRTHPPNVRGPVRAIVTDNDDPDGFGRVKVKFVGDMTETTESGWARVLRPAHRKDRRRFEPNINDEVLVDFVRGDPLVPVVIGALYNGVDKPMAGGKIYMVGEDYAPSPNTDTCWSGDPNVSCPQFIYFFDENDPNNESLSFAGPEDRFELTNDLALGGSSIFLNKDGPEAAQYIYFYDTFSSTGQAFSWDEGGNSFHLTNDLKMDGALEASGQLKGASLDVGDGPIWGGTLLDMGSGLIKGGDVLVTGAIQSASLTATGAIQGGSTLTLPGPILLDGAYLSQAGGLFSLAGGLSVSGGATLTGDLSVGGGDITATTLNIAPTSQLLLSGSTVSISSSNTLVGSNGPVSNMIDADNNSSTDSAGWYHDGSLANAKKLADLQESGSLRVRGSITPFVGFDVAESFRASEPVEAGDLVRLDPETAGSIRLTRGTGDPLVIGVISETPGIVLGGGSFDPASLSSAWGDDVRALYESDRARLRGQVLGEHEELRRALEEMEPRDEMDEAAPTRGVARADNVGDGAENAVRGAPKLASGEDRAAARREIEERIEARSLERFHEERFAPVALAGRVPVKVDASFGAIRPGDALTPGPEPGVAVRAAGPGPVVGTALEGLAEGRGKVLAFIHRGQHVPPAGPGTTDGDGVAGELDGGAVTGEDEAATLTTPQKAAPAIDNGAPFTIHTRSSEGRPSETEVLRVDAEGNVYARGAFHPASMDLAEYFPLSEPAAVGDLLVVDPDRPGHYGLARRASDPAAVGIVSAEPGVLLGSGLARIASADASLSAELDEARRLGDEERQDEIWAALEARFQETHAPVALSGTVLCNVDAGYGAIEPGDLLTTSPTPGHAMRADDPVPGTIVGKALEPLDDGMGRIRVLVMMR